MLTVSPSSPVCDILSVILACRDIIQDKAGYDILDNQNYNTLRLLPVMEAIDPSFDMNMKRNGADYWVVNRGELIEGEMKAAKKGKKLSTLMRWTFHALAILKNGYEHHFLFYVHNAGQPVRIYDIRDPIKVTAINDFITAAATGWKADVISGAKDGKNDMISIPESEVLKLFADEPVYEFDGFEIIDTARASIISNDDVVSIYSDFLSV